MPAPPAAPRHRSDPHARQALLPALLRLVDLAVGPLQDELGRRHGLGLSEWRVLGVLSQHPRITATEIARRAALDKMTVSRALAALEATGRIVRRPDPGDGRRALAALTASGRALSRALGPLAQAREAAVVAGLSQADRRHLHRLVARLIAELTDPVPPEPR